MAAGAVDVTIAATPDEVWAKVGDFGGIDALFPTLESFRTEGDDRIIGMFGMEIRERLLARDEENRVLTYSVIDGVPIESHTATISVERRWRRLEGDLGLRRAPRRNGADLRRHLQGRAGLAGEHLLLTVALGRGCAPRPLAYPDCVTNGAADAPVGTTPPVQAQGARGAQVPRACTRVRCRARCPRTCRASTRGACPNRRAAPCCAAAGPSPRSWPSTSRRRPSASCAPSARARSRQRSWPGPCARASRTSAGPS